MSKIFYVSYDIREDGDSIPLISELERLKGKRVLESVWSLSLKDTNTPEIALKHFLKFVDENAGLVVIHANDAKCENPDNYPHEIN